MGIRLRLLAGEGEWVVEPLGYRRLEYTTNCKYALSGSGCLDSLNVCHRNGPFPCSNGSNQKMMDLCAPRILERKEMCWRGFFNFYAAAWLLEDVGGRVSCRLWKGAISLG